MERWEGVPVEDWRRLWRLPELHVHASTRSTNDDARGLASNGSPAGTVVIAEHQSAGRGREGRAWEAEPARSLLLSVVLRPFDSDPATIPPATPLRVGLAAAAAIESSAGIRVRLKWPNDILAPDGRKLAGILCEATQRPAGTFVIAGIGVNVLQRHWPEPLAEIATSVVVAAGRATARSDLAAAILDALRPFRIPPGGLDENELREFRRLDALRGRPVDIDGVRAGRADGVEPDGALRIVAPTGVRLVRAGTVRPAQEHPREPFTATARDGAAPASP